MAQRATASSTQRRVAGKRRPGIAKRERQTPKSFTVKLKVQQAFGQQHILACCQAAKAFILTADLRPSPSGPIRQAHPYAACSTAKDSQAATSADSGGKDTKRCKMRVH